MISGILNYGRTDTYNKTSILLRNEKYLYVVMNM